MCSYNKTKVSAYDITKLAIHFILRPEDDLISNCGQNFKKTVSFDKNVNFIDEEDIVTYEEFDCRFTFNPESPTKIRQINRERNYISRSCEKSKCIPSNNRHNFFILMSIITLISFWTRTIYGAWFQQFLCHSATIMIHTLCSISTLNQQLNNLEQTHTRCSLHYERWTVKRRDCASALHSFKEITYRTDEWTKQLLRLKSWVIFGSPEQWMELHPLWWTVIVSKCSYLFQLFDFYCLLVQYLLFFENLHFCFFSLMTLSEK